MKKSTSNIVIETLNGIEFKVNTKSSNYYIKENGKFVRVKVAEFTKRKVEAFTAECDKVEVSEPTDSDKMVLVDLNKMSVVSDVESYEISCKRKKYIPNQVYLGKSIAQKHGVLFVLSKKRINGMRIFKFVGDFEKIQSAISEFNKNWNIICNTAKDNDEMSTLSFDMINSNKSEYKNIDDIVSNYRKNSKSVSIKY